MQRRFHPVRAVTVLFSTRSLSPAGNKVAKPDVRECRIAEVGPRMALPSRRLSPSGMDSAAGRVPLTGREGAGMRHTLIGKNAEPTPELQECLESRVAKLHGLILTFSGQLVPHRGVFAKISGVV